MKQIEFHLEIKNTMKIKEFQPRIKKNNENFRILKENPENHENSRTTRE